MTTLRSRRLHPRLVATLIATALMWGQAPTQARHPELNLDALSDSAIDRLLQAELDEEDLEDCGLPGPNARVANAKMVEIILCALGDDGDDDDEDDLDYDDLEDEMEEAGTTLEAVVRRAIQNADAIAAAPGELQLVALGLAEVTGSSGTASTDPVWSWAEASAAPVPPQGQPVWLLAKRDGYTDPGRSAPPVVKREIVSLVRSVPK
jgi:hypothetical protein